MCLCVCVWKRRGTQRKEIRIQDSEVSMQNGAGYREGYGPMDRDPRKGMFFSIFEDI